MTAKHVTGIGVSSQRNSPVAAQTPATPRLRTAVPCFLRAGVPAEVDRSYREHGPAVHCRRTPRTLLARAA